MKKNTIKQSGGNISANNLVVGDKARIKSDHQNLSFNKTEVEEISKLIDELISKINLSQEPINDKTDIITSFETLKTEVNKEKPSKITLTSIGKTLLENLKYVKDIAPFVHIIWDKISALTF